MSNVLSQKNNRQLFNSTRILINDSFNKLETQLEVVEEEFGMEQIGKKFCCILNLNIETLAALS